MNEPRLQTTDRHTPGPWRAAKTPINPWWNIYVGDGDRSVAEIDGARAVAWNDPDRPEVVEANARLIAAAPDMLAMLRQIASECGGCGGKGAHPVDTGMPVNDTLDCADCYDVRSVIAKAEGRS